MEGKSGNPIIVLPLKEVPVIIQLCAKRTVDGVHGPLSRTRFITASRSALSV